MKKYWKKKWNIVLYFVLFGISIVFVGIAGQSGEQYRFERYESLTFELPWNYQFSDGTKGITDLPAELEVDNAQQLVLTNTLPAVDTGMSFFYRARHTNAKIYIGGELVYNQEEGKDGSIYETAFSLPGNVWDEVHLTKEDSHKQVKIVLSGNVLKYLKAPGEVFIGDRGTFFVNLLKEKMGNIIGGTLLMLLSAILLALWIVLSISTHAKYNECLCLALFTFTVACWQFTETRCLQFIFPNQRMFSVLAFEFLMLSPVPIALYFTYGKREETRKRARIAAIIPLLVWIFNNTCHFLHIFDISETLIVTQVMIALETIYLGYIQICDLFADKRTNGKEGGGFFWWIPSVGFILLSPLLLLEVLKYITNYTLKYDDNTILPTIGSVIYIMSLAIHSGLKLASENFMVTEASRAKSNFLANTSHDIRTPLNAILGFNDLILRDSEEEKTREYAMSIKSAGNSLLDIINNILDLSKLESGKLELEESEYSTEQMIDNVTSMIRALAQKKDLTVAVTIDENLPKYLIGDKVRIRQVLVNLMTNAVKYTQKGGVKLDVKVVEKDEQSCQILFAVKDTGIGIREEDRDRLFKKFERLDSEKNRNVEGTGLGMSIVVKLLESMNSKIELESVYGKGSTFYFVLEQKVADDACVGVYLQKKKKLQFKQEEENILIAPDAKVLIVDDVMLNLQVAKGLLEVMKMQIDTAESGQEAIDLTLQNHYDLILMDHMMPGMDGIAATRAIRELADTTGDSYYKKVPILALTANALSGMREKFLQEGMQDYISKPVEEKTLVDAVTKWLPQEKLIPKKKGWDKEKKSGEEKTDETDAKNDWNIEIPGMDIESAKAYLLNKEMYVETLRIFFDSIPQNLEKIEKYCRECDEKNYTITVHGLKSSAKIIGARELSEEAERLENLSHAGKVEMAWQQTGHLLELYQWTQDILADFFHADVEPPKTAYSMEEFKESLGRLKKAAENFQMEEFFAWEKETESMSAPQGYEEDWKKLRDAVRNVAFSETVERIEGILAQKEQEG